MFRPVDLVSPSGQRYTARDAVDLNDRIAEGYQRYYFRPVPPRPSPTPRIAEVESSDIDADSDTDTDEYDVNTQDV